MRELEEKLTHEEISQWMLFDVHWGLPDVVGDIQNAILCALAVNMMRSAEQPSVDPSEFRVLRERGPEQQDFVMTEAQRFKAAFGS